MSVLRGEKKIEKDGEEEWQREIKEGEFGRPGDAGREWKVAE